MSISSKKPLYYQLKQTLLKWIEGGGVVFVSSELTEMIENCDRILLIKYNRIVGELRDVARLGLTEDSLMAAIQ